MPSPEDADDLQAVVLVGGRGTRLGALAADTPKPLLPVGGRPFLDHVVDELARHGFRRILLLAGHLAGAVEDFARRRREGGLDVRCRVETAPLGTGGALAGAADLLAPRFLLLNGDSVFHVNLLDLVARADADPGAIGHVALRLVPDTARYGAVRLEGARIVAFAEKRADGGPGPINAGIYRFDRRILDRIPPGPASLERDVMPALAAAGALRGHVHDGWFVDIGIPEDLARADRELPAMRRRPALFLDRDGVLNVDTGHPHRIDQWRWIPGARAAVRRANDAGWFVFVVTNQGGVARGLYGEDDVRALHRWVNAELRREGAHVDDFRHCPHHPEGAVAAYRAVCRCRKPAPGMIADLLAAWPVDAARSVLVGDRETDVRAAAAAGLPGVLFDGTDLDATVAALISGR
ncbi:MAG: HAD-IIIA family hydrolase [Rhodospirillales bacterium]